MRRNFVLSGCSIFHAKFLEEYTYSEAPAMVQGRKIVDDMFNGEDILFAFMHAKRTGLGPLIEGAKWDQKLMAEAPGLQKRGGHYSGRASAISTFVSMFEELPLKPALGIHWYAGHPHIMACDSPEAF